MDLNPLNFSKFKSNIHKAALIAVVSIIFPASVKSQNQDLSNHSIISFTERFGVGSAKLYESTNLKRFSQRLDSLVQKDSLGKIDITGYASLDGSLELNNDLAYERAEVMENWLVNHLPVYSKNNISVFYNGQDWNLLSQLVIDDTEVPQRDRAIEIINSDLEDKVKISLLKQLSSGDTWTYLIKNVFPFMRVAVVNMEIIKNQIHNGSTDIVTIQPVLAENFEVIEPATEEIVEVTELIREIVDCDEYSNQRLALKTNMLYDVALMPSLEVEYKFNDKWSVGLEANIAWWLNEKRNRRYQIMTFTPEVRYHFKSDKPWQGHYLGLFAGGGKYDLENGRKGYMGEGGYLGISYNYMWSISNTFSLELGLGVGGMFTRYKEYLPIDGRSVYQQTKNMWYGGPLRLKFALVWKIWDVKNKGGKK
ncbi:MAG: DUF3575 domain-containing protein [Muribaculaceae bacterium]|nr:DUF3575 domain-containing protein [Muribaculaceae bacterium]